MVDLFRRKEDLITATWKGGTTTQLFIYPAGTEYQQFNFDFRMSYATVEIPESTFTFMPGVTRHLMILRGELEIDHTDRYKKHLKKFDQDVFDGEWPTTAKGMVMDFNLMTRNGAQGEIHAKIIITGNTERMDVTPDFDFTGIYLLDGTLEITTENDHIILNTGDFILFSHATQRSFKLSASATSEVIFARVKKSVLS